MADTSIKSEIVFNSSPELLREYGTYENYQLKMRDLLKSTPLLWFKGKLAYEAATADYNKSSNLFYQLKAQQDKAQNDYNAFVKNYMQQYNYTDINQVPSGVLSQFKGQAGLTVDLIKNTSDAELAMDLALDRRYAAVDMQRHGLYFNV